MAWTPEEGKGVLWTNDKKGNPKAPDLKGAIMLNGVEIRLSGWSRQASTGPCVSLLYNAPYNNGNQQAYPREVGGKDDQDIPF